MKRRSLAIGATLAPATLAVALALARSTSPPRGAVLATPRETRAAVEATIPPAPALEELRDVFRFADEARTIPAEAAERQPDLAAEEPAPDPSEPRLVGLVRRSGLLLAALAVEGEVVLASPGQAAGDFTVVSVDDESVRIRDGGGGESTLVLP